MHYKSIPTDHPVSLKGATEMETPTTLPMEERKKYVFRPGMLDLGRTGTGRKDQDNGWMPSITLYESETGIPVAHPGVERWYVRFW